MNLILTLALWLSPQPCVNWYSYCLPDYVARWVPVEPVVDPGPVSVVVDTEAEVREIAEHFWPAWAVDRMVRIAECETVPDWNARSLNPSSGAAGLWQIMPQWQKVWPGDYFDPWVNGAVAYQVWLEQGFGAWVCSG